MPTGYTVGIEDGTITTGKEFLMKCIRNFGVQLELKDEPLSVEAKTHFEPSKFLKAKHDDAIKELNECQNYSFDQWRRRLFDLHIEETKRIKKSLERAYDINAKYKKVRKEVEAWIPPTIQHKGIKEFALEQIDMCMYSDDFIEKLEAKLSKDCDLSDKAIKEFIESELEYLSKEVKFTEKHYKEDLSNAEGKNIFMKQFCESLEGLTEEK